MAADLRQSILGDLRTIINDAWDFFGPPLIKFAIALFFFWYICGSEPFYDLRDNFKTAAASWDPVKVTNFFDTYKLTSLLPIAALFLIAVFVYVINRIIFGVAALLPVNLGYSSDRIERMIQEDPMMQKHLESFPSYSGYMLVDFALAKARSQKEEALLRNVDNLEQERNQKYGLFTFAKFLLAWTIACCVLSLTLSSATVFTYSRVILLLFTVFIFGVYAALKYAKSLEYLGYAQVQVVRLMLLGENYLAKPKPAATVVYPERQEDKYRREQRRRTIEYLRQSDWWFLSLRLMDWWEVLKYYRHYDPGTINSDRKRFLQTVLRNSANILWFIIGALLIWISAKFSWWLGVALFVGYVSITIVDCLLVVLLVGAVTFRSLSAVFTAKLPAIITDFLPAKPEIEIGIVDDWQYRLTVVAIRLLEGLFAIILCRALANYFF